MKLYESDFFIWTQEQAQLLRKGKLDRIDFKNVAEEIESLGKRDRRELISRLGVLIGHLLKWQYQPSKRSDSWTYTIDEQRTQIELLLADSPSLRSFLLEALDKGYSQGTKLAANETRLASEQFPTECPYTIEEILAPDFLP